MDRDTAALGDVPDDQVARHRLAALRVPHHQPVYALDLDAAAEPEPLDDPAERRRLGRLELLGWQFGVQRPHHGSERDVTPSQRGLQLLRRPDGEVDRGALQPCGVRRGQTAPPHLPREDLLPELEPLLLLPPPDPLPVLFPAPAAFPASPPTPRRPAPT